MMKKKISRIAKRKALIGVIRSLAPHEILKLMSAEYRRYIRRSASDAENDFWDKCSLATANLGSGTEKWLVEWLSEGDHE